MNYEEAYALRHASKYEIKLIKKGMELDLLHMVGQRAKMKVFKC
jgi:hypothetical protein